jgi:acetylornithine deacetylase
VFDFACHFVCSGACALNNEALQNAILNHLKQLVRFDTRNPPRQIGTDGIFQYIKEQLDGFAIELIDHDAGSVSLLAVRGEPSFLFNAHLDTVPASDAWTASPFDLRIEGDKAIGLGACDIKGAAAVLIALAQSTTSAMALLFTSDEEANDARGVNAFLQRHAPRFDAVIVAEPTQCQAVLAHRGISSVLMKFTADAGHASQANALHTSAVHHAMRWGVQALDFVETLSAESFEQLQGLRMNIGRVEGGIKANMIAPNCELRFGFRPLPSQDFSELHQRFSSFSNQAQYQETFRGPCLPAINAKRQYQQTLKLVQGSGLIVGSAVDFWTEASLFSEAGLPALVLGPGDIAQAHTADEWVSISQLMAYSAEVQKVLNMQGLGQ